MGKDPFVIEGITMLGAVVELISLRPLRTPRNQATRDIELVSSFSRGDAFCVRHN